MSKLLAYDPENQSEAVMRWNILSAMILILFGLFCQGDPVGALNGVKTILVSDGSLITDYFVTGGLGGAFVNAGLAMLLSIAVFKFSGAGFGGGSFGVCYIVAGFALFGKNVLNMLPTIFGAWLYAKAVKEPFSKFAMGANLTTCAGPIVQYVMLHGLSSSVAVNTIVGLLLAVLIGFVVQPTAAYCAKLHEGFCLYNIGLTTGFVTIILTAFMKGLGYEFSFISDSWCKDYKGILTIFFIAFYALHFFAGMIMNGGVKGLGSVMKHTGQLPCDYVALEGLPKTLMNMGILGWEMLAIILAINGDLSGPICAGVLTVGGFGGLGKNYYNVLWGWLGIFLLSFVSVWHLNDAAVQLAFCFVTCVCGIAGKYGPIYGIVAGMLHVMVVRQTGSFFAWINLYNNGFAAGLFCIAYIPVIHAIQRALGKE